MSVQSRLVPPTAETIQHLGNEGTDPDDLDESERFCSECYCKVTQSPTHPDVEYGHAGACEQRPDDFPGHSWGGR